MLHILTEWGWEPLVLTCIAIATGFYVVGMVRMGRTQRQKILGRRRVWAFFSGMLILFLTLESPLDTISDDLSSAHMAQHMLLILIIPALLVYGRPVITWLWAFDLGARRGIVRGWKRSGLQALFDWLTRPLVSWVLLSAALCFWNLPGPYDAAVRLQWLHDLEHLSYLGFSLSFWTIVIEPYGQRRRLSYAATIVYVVASGFVMSLIGAILVFATYPLYVVHLHTTQAFGLTPLQDQELAGAIMWIPSNFVHFGTLCTLFLGWYGADQRAGVRLRSSSTRTAMRSLFILPILLFGALALAVPERAFAQQPSHAEVQRGARLIRHFGCGSCHTIPGIGGADGLVGPPLTHWHERSYIAGLLPNTPDNLAFWIQDPQKVIKGVAMPDTGVNAREARAIAAYLDTIH